MAEWPLWQYPFSGIPQLKWAEGQIVTDRGLGPHRSTREWVQKH